MAFDLHPIICTWDVVTTCIPVTIFFPLGVWLCNQRKQRYKWPDLSAGLWLTKFPDVQPLQLLVFSSLGQKKSKAIWCRGGGISTISDIYTVIAIKVCSNQSLQLSKQCDNVSRKTVSTHYNVLPEKLIECSYLRTSSGLPLFFDKTTPRLHLLCKVGWLVQESRQKGVRMLISMSSRTNKREIVYISTLQVNQPYEQWTQL